ncbi:MAG TPA: tRNA (N(6)-L-threonylcarbamoyladenosine(37)-C(2))-methylthiotransferase MtaB [Firmicutes bacterium]|nr:tRNA (N(6)-L-threonylcarbamoyladenosine(37)-C(2))-methylthiotransferase MtaB [Bacillota bacterium]
MKFTIITLGCKVNSYESEYIKEKFNEKGYREVSLKDIPDVAIINTCSVTNQSDAKSRHFIRLARRMCPDAIIVACGCSVQNHKEGLRETGADILLGNKDKSLIVDYVEKFKLDNKPTSKFYELEKVEFEDMFLKNKENHTRAFVKIQDGCENFCSYCIIPYLRGSRRNKDIDLANEEIRNLVAMGHKEIVLTGIHTGSYGVGESYDLVDLIQRISSIPELERIRISSIEITELGSKFLEELSTNPKLCDHMHIPLQSGSNKILKLMNRKYDLEYFKNKIDSIRKIRPDMNITTDLIVGFPYETDEDFDNTLKFLKEIGFTKIHTFPFSLRNGTEAEKMKEHFVDEKTKSDRVHKVLELSDKLEETYYRKFIGRSLDIIVEKSSTGTTKGHTSNYILVNIEGQHCEGETVKIKIDSVDGKSVNGHEENIE